MATNSRFNITTEFILQQLESLKKLKDGEVKKIDPVKNAKWIEAVKKIIDEELDLLNGFEVIFSSDYKKIKKTKYSYGQLPIHEIRSWPKI